MRALTIDAHGGLDALRYRDDLPAPVLPERGSVRVRLRAAALNHLDLFVLGGIPGVSIAPGWVMGADGTGVVAEVSAGVTTVAVGDRVLINPGISCRDCEFCRGGEQSLCVRYRLLGEHLPGTFADEVIVPATNVRRCPPTLSDEAAAAFTLRPSRRGGCA